MTTISETKVLEDETVAKLQAAIDDFKKIFKSSVATAAAGNDEDPLEGELQEQIVAVKK
jgi:F-type H+-transporting ATPase subunit alpha